MQLIHLPSGLASAVIEPFSVPLAFAALSMPWLCPCSGLQELAVCSKGAFSMLLAFAMPLAFAVFSMQWLFPCSFPQELAVCSDGQGECGGPPAAADGEK